MKSGYFHFDGRARIAYSSEMKQVSVKRWVKPQLKSKPVSFECTAYAGVAQK